MTEANGFPYLPLKWLLDTALGHVTWRASVLSFVGSCRCRTSVSLLTQGCLYGLLLQYCLVLSWNKRSPVL